MSSLVNRPSPEYAYYMENLIIDNNLTRIVEIGVAQGDSIIRLCHGANKTNGEVYGYNNWTEWMESVTLQDVLDRIEYFDLDNCKLFDVDTQTPEFSNLLFQNHHNKPIDLVFIDGDHQCKSVKNDFVNIQQYASLRCFFIFDNMYLMPDLRRCVEDIATEFRLGISLVEYNYFDIRKDALAVLKKGA